MDIKQEISSFVQAHQIDDLVATRLGWYVYGIYKPSESLPLYIGKGQGSRVLQHFGEAVRSTRSSEKLDVIRSMFQVGTQPVIRIMRSGIPSEDQAYLVESALIDAMKPLGNKVLGHDSDSNGLIDLRNLVAEYGAVDLNLSEIQHSLLLIKIDRRWKQESLSQDLDLDTLYDSVFGYWRINPAKAEGRLVAAVAKGIIREIYCVSAWSRAGKAYGEHRTLRQATDYARWEFEGAPAPDSVRKLYVGRSVTPWFSAGAQTPIMYLPAYQSH
jgi:hypothetical protein